MQVGRNLITIFEHYILLQHFGGNSKLCMDLISNFTGMPKLCKHIYCMTLNIHICHSKIFASFLYNIRILCDCHFSNLLFIVKYFLSIQWHRCHDHPTSAAVGKSQRIGHGRLVSAAESGQHCWLNYLLIYYLIINFIF